MHERHRRTPALTPCCALAGRHGQPAPVLSRALPTPLSQRSAHHHRPILLSAAIALIALLVLPLLASAASQPEDARQIVARTWELPRGHQAALSATPQGLFGTTRAQRCGRSESGCTLPAQAGWRRQQGREPRCAAALRWCEMAEPRGIEPPTLSRRPRFQDELPSLRRAAPGGGAGTNRTYRALRPCRGSNTVPHLAASAPYVGGRHRARTCARVTAATLSQAGVSPIVQPSGCPFVAGQVGFEPTAWMVCAPRSTAALLAPGGGRAQRERSALGARPEAPGFEPGCGTCHGAPDVVRAEGFAPPPSASQMRRSAAELRPDESP